MNKDSILSNDTRISDAHTREQSNETRHDKEINQLAREWADYVGGLSQARKVVREAYSAGFKAGKDQ